MGQLGGAHCNLVSCLEAGVEVIQNVIAYLFHFEDVYGWLLRIGLLLTWFIRVLDHILLCLLLAFFLFLSDFFLLDDQTFFRLFIVSGMFYFFDFFFLG